MEAGACGFAASEVYVSIRIRHSVHAVRRGGIPGVKLQRISSSKENLVDQLP
jgi:hypothetical protein